MKQLKVNDMVDSPLERNLGFLLGDVSRLLKRQFDRRIKSLGLNRSQWFVLALLYRADGVTQTELADLLDVEKAPLGRTLDRLEESGWINRKPDATDRRVNLVFITDKINPFVEELRGQADRLYDDTCKGMSKEDRDKFIELLAAAKKNLLLSSDSASGNSGSVRADSREGLLNADND
jgi:DNA-binding MarR family transcriptional regulator